MRLSDIGGKLSEGYRVVPGFDRDKYQERQGLEGPFHTKSGKVVYYDKVEGKYYDPDTDMYIEYDDWQAMNEQGVAEGWFTDLFKKKQAPAKPTLSAEEFEQKAKSWKKSMLTAYKKIPELIQLNQWAQVKATASKVKNGLQKGINEGYITFESPEKAENAKKRVNSALNVKIFDEIKVNIKPEDFAGGGTGALLGLAVGGPVGAAIGGVLGSSRRANKQAAQQLAIANAQSAAQHKTASNRQDNKEAVIQRITKFEPTFIKIISQPTKTISNNLQVRNDSGRIEPTFEQGVAEGSLHNPGEEDSPVAQAITRRILLQRTDLLAKYGPEKVGQAIDEVADFVGDVDEIGSSDVSGWVRQVETNLKDSAVGESEEQAPKSALGKALWRDLSKFKKASPAQQQRNKERWAQRQKEREQGVAEGAKVDRMVKHIAKSEREAGKSAEEAEDIAWATANKRGYLDNKNKKAK